MPVTNRFHTTTPLAASGAYESPVFSCTGYRRVVGRVFADQAGTLKILHSEDGATWDAENIAVTANTVVFFDKVLYLQFVKIRYENGATAQTAFRLSGHLKEV